MAFDIKFNGSYLAIDSFKDWKNVSGLVVLTGHNGSGKSQLLRLIDAKVNGLGQRKNDAVLANAVAKIEITGETFSKREVLLFEDSHTLGDGGSVSVVEFHNTAERMLNDFKKGGNNHFSEDNSGLQALKAQIQSTAKAKGLEIRSLEVDQFKSLIIDDWFVFDITQIYKNLAQIFRKYHSDLTASVMAEKFGVGEAKKKWETESPWAELNALLAKTTLGFKLTDCWGLPPEAPYSLRFVNSNGVEIKPHDLSAGERAITKILLLTFVHNYKTARPKLILLDEQDAHLEPSAIDGFLESIKNTIVDKFNCHVILTTHRSETIALAPEASLYELKKNPSEIVKIHRDDAISKISRNLLRVWTEGQLVLVEADDDQKFYSGFYGLASKQKPALASKRLSFISVQKKDGSGGCDLVEKHVSKMNGFTKGILDGDNKPENQKNVVRIGRYSIENYYLDPHVVLSLLIEKGKFDNSDIQLDQTVDGSRLADVQHLSEANLQKFADWLYPKVLPHIKKEAVVGDSTPVLVEYTNGKSLKIPTWLIKTRGHDLMGPFKEATSCMSIQNDELHKHAEYQNTMVAKDFLHLFERV